MILSAVGRQFHLTSRETSTICRENLCKLGTLSLGRGKLDGLQGLLRAKPADDHRQMVWRTRGSTQSLEFIPEKLQRDQGIHPGPERGQAPHRMPRQQRTGRPFHCSTYESRRVHMHELRYTILCVP